MTAYLTRIPMFFAGPTFAAGLAIMQPQMTALEGLSGPGAFLASLAAEPNAWLAGHLLMLAAAVLYLFAAIGIARELSGHRPVTARLLPVPMMIGTLGLVGNFTLDLVYGALATGLEPEAALLARDALLASQPLQMTFAMIGPMLFPLGMFIIALPILITGWLPRIAGALILGGWAFVMTQHGAFPYAEAVGHFIVGSGFIWIAVLSRPDRPARPHRRG
ncbi:hypothetical protein [Maricaulis sp.]|uniref:hypothetical protein n=1 Tax=Maricaulis sp. TaxID=1486257 RepID=UPI002B2755C2|nr:hypothetical protein [Maricaulis sp.]